MVVNRNETAPKWLLSLAATALGLSWLLSTYAISQTDPVPSARNFFQPKSGGLLFWSATKTDLINQSRDLEEIQILTLSNQPNPTFTITSSTLEQMQLEDPLWLLTAEDINTADLIGNAPIQLSANGFGTNDVSTVVERELVILLPSQAKLSAANPAWKPQLVAKDQWNVFGWNSFASVNQVGRWWGSNMTQTWSVVPNYAADYSTNYSANLSAARSYVTPRLQSFAYQLPAFEELHLTKQKATVSRAELTISDYLAKERASTLFPIPHSLGEQLDRLAAYEETTGWAWSFAYRLRGFISTESLDTIGIERSLSVLAAESSEAVEMAESTADPQLATELRRAHYAIERRLDSWQALVAERSYRLDEQKAIASQQGPTLFGNSSLEDLRWAMASNSFHQQPTISLRIAQPSEPLFLAANLESFEKSPSSSEAQEIARKIAILAERKNKIDNAIVESVKENYCNANLRLAISKDLIQQLFEEASPSKKRVNDRIAGTPVRGISTTRSKLIVNTIPDDNAWRLGIKTSGVVESDTVAFGGPARLRSIGKTTFTATKELKIGFNGISTLPALAKANREGTRLISVRTKYDKVPLFGNYARSTAKKEHHKARSRVKAEVERKVAQNVRLAIDNKADPAMQRLQDKYNEMVLGRAKRLGVDVEPIELRTTDTRLIGRIRLANNQQLAAHTPRMRAPSDSVFSCQIHESMVNNAMEGLSLEGEQFTASELRQRINETFEINTTSPDAVTSKRVKITFKQQNPVRINFEDGKVRLTLALKEMSIRGTKQTNFKVHVIYRPEIIDNQAWLVQTGVAQIEGRMRASNRIRLHAALGRVLGEERRLPLVRVPADAEPEMAARLAEFATTQLVIEDGWLGVAVGPARTEKVAVKVGNYAR